MKTFKVSLDSFQPSLLLRSLIVVFHFCVQDPDVEGLAERIVEAGGKKRMQAPRYYYPGEKPYRMIYMEDPFGNILEIYSHSYELIYSAGAY